MSRNRMITLEIVKKGAAGVQFRRRLFLFLHDVRFIYAYDGVIIGVLLSNSIGNSIYNVAVLHADVHRHNDIKNQIGVCTAIDHAEIMNRKFRVNLLCNFRNFTPQAGDCFIIGFNGGPYEW